MIEQSVREKLLPYAQEYERAEFINGDPSWFMHQVSGDANRETMAFLAQSISYGSRAQFLPKIQWMLEKSGGEPLHWVLEGVFENDIQDSGACFYRLYTRHEMLLFLRAYRRLLGDFGSLHSYVGANAGDAREAVKALCGWFATHDGGAVIPKDDSSACKRVCMFLRWMVRSGSPVDLGLWKDIIDRRSLIMPLDTHVLQEAMALGLCRSKCASMGAALKLTATMAEIFPDDPLKGDFALFGYGVSNNK